MINDTKATKLLQFSEDESISLLEFSTNSGPQRGQKANTEGGNLSHCGLVFCDPWSLAAEQTNCGPESLGLRGELVVTGVSVSVCFGSVVEVYDAVLMLKPTPPAGRKEDRLTASSKPSVLSCSFLIQYRMSDKAENGNRSWPGRPPVCQ